MMLMMMMVSDDRLLYFIKNEREKKLIKTFHLVFVSDDIDLLDLGKDKRY